MADGTINEDGLLFKNEILQISDVAPHGGVATVEFSDDERVAAFEALLPVRLRAAVSVKSSAISSAQGRNPAAKIDRMVLDACFMELNPTARQAREGGRGISFKVASVTMPSSPSLPTKRR